MTDSKNTNELNDEELDTVNGGIGINPDLNNMTGVKKTIDADIYGAPVKNQKLEIKQGTGNDEENMENGATPFGKGKNLNPFNARFGLGKKFGRNQTKLDD